MSNEGWGVSEPGYRDYVAVARKGAECLVGKRLSVRLKNHSGVSAGVFRGCFGIQQTAHTQVRFDEAYGLRN